ncbi:MAG TPA: PQQ-binding-like beta-propeller repeat protein [Humisphaera sp.]|jgi:outer membrane protein assembly factor BamB|nr:PQQ-binding-like beta-propeller repeat protein [Humisphaera sp.]
MADENQTIPQAQTTEPLEYRNPGEQRTPAMKPPRIWPAVAIVALLWGMRLYARLVDLTTFHHFITTFLSLLAGMALFLGWWLISRRTSIKERLLVLVAVVLLCFVGQASADVSMRGMMWVILAMPFVLTTWTIWWGAARNRSPGIRTGGLIAILAITCGSFELFKMAGLDGEQHADLRWRWGPATERIWLAGYKTASLGQSAVINPSNLGPVVLRPDDWPGFRGPLRDGSVHGLQIATDWAAHPPKLLWRQQAGPGWSSPIVVGGRLFTHEQQGGSEVVVCRDAATGSVIWICEDAGRFDESMSGPGPRATPTFSDGKIYSLGATGVLNCLDATNGARIWTKNIATDSGVAPPMWGFASSPLIQNGMVIVYVGGAKGLLAYHADTGKLAWNVVSGTQSYTSAQPAILNGQEQALFLSDAGLVGVDAVGGRVLWTHDVVGTGMPRSIQPHVISPTQVLISSETDLGTAEIDVASNNNSWSAKQAWVSRQLKPSFDDYVIQDGYAYGFDGAVFSCIDIRDGKRMWRGGHYGHGQVVLLADQKLLLVIGEEGQAILLRATPKASEEIAQFQAISGKTWNHPAIAGGRLYVRNGQEAAAFELPR